MAGSGAGVEGLVLRGWDCMCHFEQRRESESRNLHAGPGHAGNKHRPAEQPDLSTRCLVEMTGGLVEMTGNVVEMTGNVVEMTKDHSERSIALVIATIACLLSFRAEHEVRSREI